MGTTLKIIFATDYEQQRIGSTSSSSPWVSTPMQCALLFAFYECGSRGHTQLQARLLSLSQVYLAPKPMLLLHTPQNSSRYLRPSPEQIRVAWIFWDSHLSLEALVNFWSGTIFIAFRSFSTLRDLTLEFHRNTGKGFTREIQLVTSPNLNLGLMCYIIQHDHELFLAQHFLFNRSPSKFQLLTFYHTSNSPRKGIRTININTDIKLHSIHYFL